MANYFRARVIEQLGIGALAASDVIASPPSNTMETAGRVSSIKATWSLSGMTTGEGPVAVGVAHPDYTAAEIEEALEAATSGLDDRTSLEHSRRLVREVGVFAEDGQLNNGRPVKTKLNWPYAEDAAPLQFWAYNLSTSALTTGTLLAVLGQLNCFRA